MISNDYIIKSLPIEILFIPLICVIIYEVFVHFVVKKWFSIGKKRIGILILIIACGVRLIIPCLQILKFGVFLPFEDYSVSNTSGYIQDADYAGRFIKNSYDESNGVRRAYIIILNNTEYLYLCADAPVTGDYIDFSFYRSSNIVRAVNRQETHSGTAEDSSLGNVPSHELTAWIKHRNAEYYIYILLTVSNIGLALLAKKRTDRKFRDDESVIYGELLFAGGGVIATVMFASIFIIHYLFPNCWLMQIPYFYLALPMFATLIIGQIPITCIFSDDKAEIIMLNLISLHEMPMDNITNVTFIKSKWGGLVYFSFSESNVLQCNSLLSFLLYSLLNRGKYLLAIQNHSDVFFSNRITYTGFVLQDIFKDKYTEKQGIFSTFPLFKFFER